MSGDRPKQDTMSLEEAALSNMWKIVALAEVLERRGLLTETENQIIDDILALNKHSLTSHQSQNLLERLARIIEMGQRVAKGTTH